MDVNGLRFWMLADARDWDARAAAHAEYDAALRRLRLASERPASAHTSFRDEAAREAAESRAKSLVEVTPQARDEYDTRGFYDAASNTVMAAGFDAGSDAVLAGGPAAGPVPLFRLPEASHPSSIVLGRDGVIYAAVAPAGEISLHDALGRWTPSTLKGSYKEGEEEREFRAWRLAADPEGGVWALDRAARKLARVKGAPVRTRPYGPYAPSTFRPCRENPDAPRMLVFGGEVCPASETPVAVACSPGGRVAVLSWLRREAAHAPGLALLRLVNRRGEAGQAVKLLEAHYPYSMAWVSDERVALLSNEAKTEALVYQLAEGEEELLPAGDVYPLGRGGPTGPFLNGLGVPPHYPRPRGTKALHRLSLRMYAREGAAANRPAGGDRRANQTALDSGSAQTVWHRLYMEALIPPGCGVRVFLAATDTPTRPADDDADEWHEHRFGDFHAGGAHVPRAAWVPTASEIPFHPGMLGCEPRENRAGLFTALVQRTRRRVRTLRGRYVHARVEMSGDGHTTPEVAALRIYASRFSYLNNYLPELYREDLFGPDADEVVSESEPPTRADFLERFLGNFEGVLTPLEGRIADAHLLTDPRTAPEGALEWLGSWLGVAFDPAYPPERRRRLLAETPQLYRERGTLRGLQRALDIVTDGAVAGGEVVVLEDFRLRRTFATILGADLADEDDPLLAGLAASGNSYVGDTFFLGDEHRKEFLALFSAELELAEEEREAVEEFFERLAHRVTILVHQEIEPQDLGLVARVAEQEVPAHVVRRVLKASYPFLVGAASLVGVDTYLGVRPPRRPVGVGRTYIGEGDYVTRPPSLDPRLGGALPEGAAALMRPVASLAPQLEVREGSSFVLDGARSRPGPGRRLRRFVWEMEE